MKAPGTVARDVGYDTAGFSILRGLIGVELVEFLAAYGQMLRSSGRMEIDHQVPGSLRRYGAPAFETLLELCGAPFSTVAGRRLLPSYSFARVYFTGQELVAHRDRPECEHSATVHIASSAVAPWPLWIRKDDREPTEVALGPGDAVLYRGDRVLHWRDPLPDEWYLQVFLHYVDAEGPHAGRHLDGRPHLAGPRQATP